MTEVIAIDPMRPDAAAIARAADAIRSGRLVAFPTETVYGLGVHALDRAAVQRLFAAKGRPATDPLIVHVRSLEAARPLLARVPDAAPALARRFWPGPLTLVLPRSPVVPDEVTAGLETVAIRVPAHPVARALLDAALVPIAAPSANLFSRPSPTRASHVLDDLSGRIDLVVDAGPTSVGLESTVLDLTRTVPAILRPGAVTAEMLEPVLGERPRALAAGAMAAGAMPSPGLLEKHYSPRAPLTLYEGDVDVSLERLVEDATAALDRGRVVGILAAREDRARLPSSSAVRVAEAGSLHDLPGVAAGLYDALRTLDGSAVDVILARGFPSGEGLGEAIADRLRRAAAGRIVRVPARGAPP